MFYSLIFVLKRLCLHNRVCVRGRFPSVWQLLLCHLITCFCSRMIPCFSLHAANLRLSDVMFGKCSSVFILEFTTHQHRSSDFDHHSSVSLNCLFDFKKKQFALFLLQLIRELCIDKWNLLAPCLCSTWRNNLSF